MNPQYENHYDSRTQKKKIDINVGVEQKHDYRKVGSRITASACFSFFELGFIPNTNSTFSSPHLTFNVRNKQ